MLELLVNGVEGIVAQHVSGNVSFAPEPQQLLMELELELELELIKKHAGGQATELADAVHELEDETAPSSTRLAAKQKIKAFLMRTGSQIEQGAFAMPKKLGRRTDRTVTEQTGAANPLGARSRLA